MNLFRPSVRYNLRDSDNTRWGFDMCFTKVSNDHSVHSPRYMYGKLGRTNVVRLNKNDYYVTWPEMVDIASNIKAGKASAGSIKPEHFLCGSPKLLRHLQLLFNGMIQHSYVPTEFLSGTISPIVKDTQGDVTQPSNYRGITLSCLPAKLFEYVIQKKDGPSARQG